MITCVWLFIPSLTAGRRPSFTTIIIYCLTLVAEQTGADWTTPLSYINHLSSMSQHSEDQLIRDVPSGFIFPDWEVYTFFAIMVAAIVLALLALLCRCIRNWRLKTFLRATATRLNADISELHGKLEIIKHDRAENKRRLQSVEAEIIEKERVFEKPEELLKEKERLLKAQWKFDYEKETCEREILNREKLLEPIENQLSRCC